MSPHISLLKIFRAVFCQCAKERSNISHSKTYDMYYIYNIIRYYITYLTQLVADDTFILDIAKDYSLLEQCTELLWLLTRILYLHIIITP